MNPLDLSGTGTADFWYHTGYAHGLSMTPAIVPSSKAALIAEFRKAPIGQFGLDENALWMGYLDGLGQVDEDTAQVLIESQRAWEEEKQRFWEQEKRWDKEQSDWLMKHWVRTSAVAGNEMVILKNVL